MSRLPARHCLDRRTGDLAVLHRELTARQILTRAGQRHVNRHSTTSDVRASATSAHLVGATVC
ncbi:hypothetical protein [Kocuria kalidii]|uniref:hypothetical protein n=1 Tax=Kocuria kalidii TaxID=3376283 RepID=UPI003798275A